MRHICETPARFRKPRHFFYSTRPPRADAADIYGCRLFATYAADFLLAAFILRCHYFRHMLPLHERHERHAFRHYALR